MKLSMDTRTIKIPNWCKIGVIVEVRYPDGRTGDKKAFYKERIIGYTDNGFITQAHNCPMYYHQFNEFGKTVKVDNKQFFLYQ